MNNSKENRISNYSPLHTWIKLFDIVTDDFRNGNCYYIRSIEEDGSVMAYDISNKRDVNLTEMENEHNKQFVKIVAVKE